MVRNRLAQTDISPKSIKVKGFVFKHDLEIEFIGNVYRLKLNFPHNDHVFQIACNF